MNFELLKRLCETPGVSGREEQIRAVVIEEMRPLVDDLSVDAMGSVVGVKRGAGGPRVLVAAHMDEIGFLVRHIDDRGFIRLQPLGGFDARVLVAQRVHVHGSGGQRLLGTLMPGSKPTHLLSDEERNKPTRLEELFVDVGLPGEHVKELVELGDPVTLARDCVRVGEHVVSKSLDNRLSVFVLLEALRQLGAHRCEVLAVATVQEEVGVRGAETAAYALRPDIGIALDTTIAGDLPGAAEQDRITRLGGGPALKIMDSSLLSHPRLVRHFRDVAHAHGIPYQLEILPRGGTDGGTIQRTRGGVPAFTLSTPSRYVHTVNEMAAVADIEAAILLLARYLEEAHTRRYGYEDAGAG
jgi:putative aminopeptidase FrvX